MTDTATTPAIEPPTAQRRGHSMSMRQYVMLVRTLASSEFKLRFADSALGYTWTLSKPLMLFGIMYLVFSEMLRFGEGIPHYPVILLMGIMYWGFFAEATSGAVTILVSRADLIRKAWFPHSALAVSVVTTAFLVFAFNLAALAVFVVINGVNPRLEWLLILPLIAEMLVFTVGLSLLLSGLFVFVRDIGQVWAVLLQLLFYATPIIYPLELLQQQGVAEWIQKLLLVNPMAQIIQDTRVSLVGGSTPSAYDVLGAPLLLVPYAVIVATTVCGMLVYRHFSSRLAEHV